MPPHPFKIRTARLPKELAADAIPYVPDTAPVVETRSGVMSRVWLEWARRVTGLAAQGSTAGGGGVPDPHAPTHEPGGTDPMDVDAAPGVGSLRTLGTGANQAAPGNDARFTAPSVPTAHATTHQPGGADAMAVDAIAATGSLRTLGTGANQAAPGNDTRFTAAPQAHHASHEPGGGDALVNAAWTNVANTFTQNQTLSKVVPSLVMQDSSGAVNGKRFSITNDGGGLDIRMESDAGVLQNTAFELTRTGSALIYEDVTVSRNAYVTGSGGNVACKDQANTFTASQRITHSTLPILVLSETSQPANLKSFRLAANNQLVFLQALDDADGFVGNVLWGNRAGDVNINRDVYEKGRPTAMGHWTSAAIGGYVDYATSGTFLHSFVGKTLHIQAYGTVAPPSPVASLNIYFPGGVALAQTGFPIVVNLGTTGGWSAGVAFISAAGLTTCALYPGNNLPWPAGASWFAASLAVPIQ